MNVKRFSYFNATDDEKVLAESYQDVPDSSLREKAEGIVQGGSPYKDFQSNQYDAPDQPISNVSEYFWRTCVNNFGRLMYEATLVRSF